MMENKYKIKNDLAKNELEMRKKTWVTAQENKLKGKELKIEYSKLIIDGNVCEEVA